MLCSVGCFLLVTSFLFFPRYAYPPHQHSFPTRRSSDLAGSARISPARRTRRMSRPGCIRPSCPPLGRIHPGRSEEHTSELQSLTNIVCRLLLEKKKRKHSITEKLRS